METFTVEKSSEHPFDDPYGIMKYLQAHIADLQTSVQSEQDVRAKEVCQLQGDIRALQEALAEETARPGAYYKTVSQALVKEAELRERTVHQCFEDLQGLSSRVTDLHKQLEVHDEQVTKLVIELRNETQERQLLDKALNQVCCTESRERKAQYEQLTKDLEELNWRTEADAAFAKDALQRLAEVGIPPPTSAADWPPNNAYQRGRFSHTTRNMQLVGLALAKGGAESSAPASTAAPTTLPPTVAPSSARGSRPYTVPSLQEGGLKLPPWQVKHTGLLPFSFVT